MAIVINSQDIVRKHEILRDSQNRELTEAEKKELADIEKIINDINAELQELAKKGFKLVNGVTTAVDEEVKPVVKNKLSPADRRMRAEELIRDGREKKLDDKAIIKSIRDKLGVSYTYGYNLLKEMK